VNVIDAYTETISSEREKKKGVDCSYPQRTDESLLYTHINKMDILSRKRNIMIRKG
jgi:cAMP phosphodiesterase